MVIEILSSRTAKEDKNRKKNVYECCGVKEYWIVDPVTKKTSGFFAGKRSVCYSCF